MCLCTQKEKKSNQTDSADWHHIWNVLPSSLSLSFPRICRKILAKRRKKTLPNLFPITRCPRTLNEKYLAGKLWQSCSPHRDTGSRQVPAEMRIRELGGDEFSHAFIPLFIHSATTKWGPQMCKTQCQVQNVTSNNERALGARMKIRRGFISAGWVEMDPKVQRKLTLLSCVKLSRKKYYMNTLQVKQDAGKSCPASTVA